jgi:hypothetical protein
MGILEPAAPEIRHRVVLAPDDVVEHPEAQILHSGTNAKNIVIGADDPNRAIRLQDAAASQEPCPREGIVRLEAFELIPMIVDSIYLRLVRPMQITIELKIVRRVSEDNIDRMIRQAIEGGNTVAFENGVEPGR